MANKRIKERKKYKTTTTTPEKKTIQTMFITMVEWQWQEIILF